MAEIVHSNPNEAASFLKRAGYQISEDKIIEVFPGYFPDRRVLRVKEPGGEETRVLKVRQQGREAQREIDHLKPLLASYRFSGGHFGALNIPKLPDSRFIVIDMPYLGRDICRLCEDISLAEYEGGKAPEGSFRGFSAQEISRLVQNLRQSQIAFSQKYDLIHGDTFQMRSPNNIVFNDTLNRLLLVDAEALTEADVPAMERFNEGLDKVEEWMCENLLDCR